jgi:ATP-dependent RNA helicase SUPV3L1/SUV3
MFLSLPDEVAIIDEIQQLKDPGRGWAWTRAFLGLIADEIHVCGEPGSARRWRFETTSD